MCITQVLAACTLNQLKSCCVFSGQIHIDRKLAEIKSKVEKGEMVKGGLLTHLLVTKEMNLEEIYANMTEMLLAGVDTVGMHGLGGEA